MRPFLKNLRPLAKWVRHGAIRIEDPTVDKRFDRYLSERFKYRSRTQWVELIESGRVLVNGERRRPSQHVRFGDTIEYVPEPKPEPEVDRNIGILAEDEVLLAADKPPNLPVHPSGRYFRNTLVSILLEARGQTLDNLGLRIVHRLDRETSGVVLFGKDRRSASFLARQFEDRRVAKQYLVLVHGRPRERTFEVDAPLGRAVDSAIRKAVAVVPDGVSAQTSFEVLSLGPEHSLLRATPRTGRLHQIRVHLKHAGLPVVGDKLYGLDERLFLKLTAGVAFDASDRATLHLQRQALHAFRLTVTHPTTKLPVTFESPLPADMRQLAADLGISIPNDC